MSINIFFNALFNKKKISLFNRGKNFRDYTYVDDVVEQIFSCIKKTKKRKKYLEIFNIGGENMIEIKKLVNLISKITKKKTKIVFTKKNKLDPIKSLASNNKLKKFTQNYKNTSIKDGLFKVYDYFLNKKGTI